MSDINDITSAYDRHAALVKKTTQSNKAAVFDALASAGITMVLATFDGEGDSGQIEDVTAYSGESEMALPLTQIAWLFVPWNEPEPQMASAALEEAVRNLCWDYLSDVHGGWENNDGGFGEFTLKVAEQEVELDFNARFTDITNHSHTF